MSDKLEVEFILRKFQDRNAVLYNESTGEIFWPIKKLPDNLEVGETITLRLVTAESVEQEHSEILKKVLEEIIN